MSSIEQALRLAEAQKNRVRRQFLAFGLIGLILLAALLLAYHWVHSPNKSVTSPGEALVVLGAVDSAAPAASVSPLASEAAHSEKQETLAELQAALTGLIEHDRFGTDSKQALDELQRLQEQLTSVEFPTLKPYYDARVASAEALLEEVSRFQDRLVKDIGSAYEKRNVIGFQEGLAAYDALGKELDRVAVWRELSPQAESLFSLLKDAETHRVQNQPRQELAALQALQKAGFKREQVPKRISELKQMLYRSSIKQQLQAAHDFYSRSEYAKARSTLVKILEAEPSNGMANQLLVAVDAELAKSRSDKALARAKQAVANDSWSEAQRAYQQALSISANHKSAMEGLQLAQAIIGVERDIQGLLAKPQRLGDKQVALYAQELLQKSEAHKIQSPALAELAGRLRHVLAQMNTPAKIAITSDGKARIEVRGVGWIEPTTYKEISLTPGRYELYAHCKGHVVGLKQLEVSINQRTLEVTIGCGRRI